MLRVGVLGAGNHSSHNHGPALARYRTTHSDRIELAAVCDLDADARTRYADRFGFRDTYEHADRMLADASLDALIAVTPVDVTREVAGELLTSGVPLLIEKPPGRTVEDARELARIAAAHESPHAVSMNRRFNPAFRRVRSWLSELPVDQRPQYATVQLRRTGRTEAGFVTGTGIHAIDAACAVLGRPRRLSVDRWRSVPVASGAGQFCAGRVQYDDAVASVSLLSAVGDRAETYEFYGPSVTAVVDTIGTECAAWVDGEQMLEWKADGDTPHDVANGTYDETAAFLEAVQGAQSFDPTLRDVLPSFALAAAMSEGRPGTITID